MGRPRKTSSGTPPPTGRKALTPEGRENQLIALAVDLAERQLIEGTASSQVITHYLKLGSMKEQLEMEKLRKENELLRAKTEAIEAQKTADDLYKRALAAFRLYNGESNDEDQNL